MPDLPAPSGVAHRPQALSVGTAAGGAKQRKDDRRGADFAEWLAEQQPRPGYGRVPVAVCA